MGGTRLTEAQRRCLKAALGGDLWRPDASWAWYSKRPDGAFFKIAGSPTVSTLVARGLLAASASGRVEITNAGRHSLD